LKKRLRPANVEVIKLKLGSQEPRVVGAELERRDVGRQSRREGIAPNPYLLDCLLWIKSRLTDSKLEIIEDS